MKKYIFMCLATLLCLEACKENERQYLVWWGRIDFTDR